MSDTGERKRLMLLLRATLADLAEKKLAHFVRDAWVLTERGMDSLDSAAMAATA
jgi:hypothetical protein